MIDNDYISVALAEREWIASVPASETGFANNAISVSCEQIFLGEDST